MYTGIQFHVLKAITSISLKFQKLCPLEPEKYLIKNHRHRRQNRPKRAWRECRHLLDDELWAGYSLWASWRYISAPYFCIDWRRPRWRSWGRRWGCRGWWRWGAAGRPPAGSRSPWVRARRQLCSLGPRQPAKTEINIMLDLTFTGPHHRPIFYILRTSPYLQSINKEKTRGV